MAELEQLRENTVIEGPFFDERVRIIAVRPLGDGQVSIVGEGLNTHAVHKPIIPLSELGKLRVVSTRALGFHGDPEAWLRKNMPLLEARSGNPWVKDVLMGLAGYAKIAC